MGINKVVYNGGTLIDLTADTVSTNSLLEGYTAHDRTGTIIIGTATGGSGDGYVWQDGEGYVHLSDDEGTQTIIDALSVNASGTYTAPTGHAYSPVTVPSGSATPASTISGTSATVSTSTNTLTLSKTVSNTPTVSAGYVSSGTAGNSSVSLTANVTTKAAATYTPSTSTQTISANQYLTGAQTINPIPSQYIVPSGTKSITSNGTGIDVASYASVDVAVPSSSPTLITKNITANGTYNASSDSADGYSSVTVNVSGGGGANNFVQGTFVAGTAGTVQTINVPYTGSGYPITLTIFVSGGVYDNGSGNQNAQTWYDAIHQYAIGFVSMVKDGTTREPQYVGTNVFVDGVCVTGVYKNSTSSNTVYSRDFSINARRYTEANPTSSSGGAYVSISSNTQFKIIVSGETSGYGFLSGLEYTYQIVYSS